jgi:hypothetical protein
VPWGYCTGDAKCLLWGKFHPRTGYEGPEGEYRYSSTLYLTSALEGVDGQYHTPAVLPRERPRTHCTEGFPVLVWTVAENLSLTGIRSPDLSAQSKSLYRLGYPSSRFLSGTKRIRLYKRFSEVKSMWGLWWGKWQWDRIFSEYVRFALSITFHQCSTLIFIYMLLLSKGQTGEAWKPSKKKCYLGSQRALYRVIKKSLCTWWLEHRNLQVMFKVSPANVQTFIVPQNCVLEDRVQYSTVHIPNVIMVSDWNCLKYCLLVFVL